MSELLARMNIGGDGKGGVKAANDVGQAMDKLGGSVRRTKSEMEQAAGSAAKLDARMRGAQGAGLALATALGAIGVREWTKQMVDAAQASLGFEVGLSAVAGGAIGANTALSFVREESARLGLSLQQSAKDFLGLAGATNGTVLAGKQTQQIWLSVAQAGLAMGKSNEEVGRGLNAISQIASKGVVSMEEIRQQLAEAIPGAVNIAARAMGMGTAEFNKLVASGKLLSTDFLPKFAAQLQSEFGPAVEKYLDTDVGKARVELGKLQTALFDLNAIGGQAFLGGLVDGLTDVNQTLGDDELAAQVRALARELGELTATGGKALAALAANADLVVIALGAFAGLRAGAALASMATGAMAAAEGVGFLAAAVAALGGPLGIVAMIAGGVAVGGIAAFAMGAADSAEASAGADRASRGLAAALDETSKVGRTAAEMTALHRGASDDLSVALKTVKGNVDGLTRSLIVEAEAARQAAIATQTFNIAEARKELRPLVRAGTREMGRTNMMAFGDPMALALGQGATFEETSVAPKTAQLEREIATAEAEIARLRGQSTKSIAANLTLPTAQPVAPTSSKGKGAKAGRMAADLEADVIALQAYREALKAGGAALDEWKIKDAGRQAVEQAGLAHKAKSTAAESALAAKIRSSAEEVERLKLANERVEKAIGLQRSAKLDTEALQRRSVAAMAGVTALEDLRVSEAGLEAMRAMNIETLDQLVGKDRAEAEAAIEGAKAKERQAIATEKAARVGETLRDLDKRIAGERARAAAVTGGAEAEIAYAQAEFERQEIERAGENLTAAQIAQIRTKADALFRQAAANDAADIVKQQTEELRLLKMTNHEREIEERFLRTRLSLLAQGKTAIVAEMQARARAIADQAAADDARAIGELKENLRKAFVETGKLSFDEVGDFVEQRLRQAVYDALLAKPIDVVINAVVGQISGLTGKLAGNALGSLFGSTAAGAAGSALGSGVGAVAGGIGALLGFGGTAGAVSAGAASVGAGAAGIASGAAASGGIMAAMGPALAVLGPIAAVAAIGALLSSSLFKDDQRPYARSDIGLVDGKFGVTGGAQLDNGPLGQMNDAAAQVAASLNAAADLFKLDLTKVGGIQASFGYVQGKNTGALGQGYFGGAGGGFSGAEFSGYSSAEELAADIVRSTILKAIDAGASDLSAAEQNVVRSAATLEEAASKITAGRSIVGAIDDAFLQLTDPAAFERKKALAAIEESYAALKTQAEELVAAGLVSADVLTRLAELKDLQVTDALGRLGVAADDAADKLAQRIVRGGELTGSIQDRIQQLTDPAGFRRRQIDEAYANQRFELANLVAVGAASADVLAQLDQLHDLEIADTFKDMQAAAEQAAVALEQTRSRLRDWLDQAALSPSAETSPQAQRAEALAQYRRQLALAGGGDTEALGSITSYADRLLSTDRTATSSAKDRLALYNQVTADIAGLAGGRTQRDPVVSTLMGLGDTLKLIAGNTALDGAGKPMVVSNLPAMQVMYGQAIGPQTDRLVAANDAAASKVVAAIDASAVATQAAMAQLEAAIGNGLAGVGEALAAVQVAAESQAAAAAAAAEESRLTNAQLRARAS